MKPSVEEIEKMCMRKKESLEGATLKGAEVTKGQQSKKAVRALFFLGRGGRALDNRKARLAHASRNVQH